MTDRTPDELRRLAYRLRLINRHDEADGLVAAADAWEADKFKTWQQIQVVVAKDERIAELEKRLEEAEKAIYDGRLYPAHFKAWADQIEIDQGYAGSEVSCLLRRLAALAGEEK